MILMTLMKVPPTMKLKRYVECSFLDLSVDKLHENENELERKNWITVEY